LSQTPDCRLRPYAYPADTLAIERMWVETFGDVWPVASEVLGRMLAGQDRRHRGWCEVFADPEPVGVIAFQQRRETTSEGSIALVLVHPNFRRLGIGASLVRSALARLRENGVRSVELGAWAIPLFWHGIPEECRAAKEFFSTLGWQYYEENMDLLVDLRGYVTPESVYSKPSLSGVVFRKCVEADLKRVLDFVRDEFSSFLPYYEEQFQLPGFICLAEAGGEIQATTIGRKFPYGSGTHWYQLLGTRFGAPGATVVSRQRRRQGIGIAISAYMLEQLQQMGCQYSFMHWTWMTDLYGQIGAKIWHRYTLGRRSL
jgi:GNAT superfamily N-acetyltransferase